MGKKILVIDDNSDDLFIIERCLKEAGYTEIVTAGDGNEGIRKANEERPDLIITDTILPEMDGFEVCRRVREFLDPASHKIVIITGSIDVVDAVKARKSGADDYCAKTSNFSALIDIVKKIL